MAEVSKEERLKLAIKAFNQGKFQSKTSCAISDLNEMPEWSHLQRIYYKLLKTIRY